MRGNLAQCTVIEADFACWVATSGTFLEDIGQIRDDDGEFVISSGDISE